MKPPINLQLTLTEGRQIDPYLTHLNINHINFKGKKNNGTYKRRIIITEITATDGQTCVHSARLKEI